MPVHDALNGRQADSGPGELGAVQPLKGAEELACVRLVEAGAVIANVVDRFPMPPVGPEPDARCGVFGREFPGISKQVLQQCPQ